MHVCFGKFHLHIFSKIPHLQQQALVWDLCVRYICRSPEVVRRVREER